MTIRYLEFRVSLLGVRPMIWRRIRIDACATFWDLHVAIQDAMGWCDTHLHVFRIVDRDTRTQIEIGLPDPDGFVDDARVVPGWEASIDSAFDPHLVPIALYEYDFGDGWIHEVVLEGWGTTELAALPSCVDGARHCPPEDVGGVGGYAEFLERIAEPASPDAAEAFAWAGETFDPEDFDPDAVVFTDPDEHWRQMFPDAGEPPSYGVDPTADLREVMPTNMTDFLRSDPTIRAALEILGDDADDLLIWMPLGQRFEAERERRALTIKALAARLRVPQYRVRAVEKGSRQAFQPDVCRKIARVLEIEDAVDAWIARNPDTARRFSLLEDAAEG